MKRREACVSTHPKTALTDKTLSYFQNKIPGLNKNVSSCKSRRRGTEAQDVVGTSWWEHYRKNRVPLPVRSDRRKQGVNTANSGCFPSTHCKNTLDTVCAFERDSVCASYSSFPQRTLRRSSPIRTPEKPVSEEYRCRQIWKKKPL